MEKPILESLTPNVIVSNVNKTVDYYSRFLGFTLIASVPETGVYNWAMVTRDGVNLMFQSLQSLHEDMPTLKIESKGSIGTFFIKLKGIEQLHTELKDQVEIASGMRVTFYGMKEFTIRDLNGYFLTFAEEIG
jgi:uncharacterized glyoxalase superfamily protein PhnB